MIFVFVYISGLAVAAGTGWIKLLHDIRKH